MIRRKGMFILVLLVMVMQAFLINKFNLLHTRLPVLDGVPVVPSAGMEYRYLLNWYLPVIGISFYFSGYLSQMMTVYGTPFFIRNYSKFRWVLKQYYSIALSLLLFVVIQMLIGLVWEHSAGIQWMSALKMTFIYYLTLLVLISFQTFLDLFVQSELSVVLVNLYLVFSVLGFRWLSSLDESINLTYLLIPNYGMGFKNGLSKVTEFQTDYIPFLNGSYVLILILILVILGSVMKINKKELI
ncbi:DUF2705 family protein [Falsibacillus albus]|uniref:DUF2705 domain-containing protein n=1 Tax=Falsibacillus albus TaxID=2478915 RepID=A0A3L7JX28_9BACI|nr:DUF2705 family protein [Falsibacillus albus]RLQ94885.1 DUF2705 domain-containing protein [Falsibacillus albus]